MNPLSFTAKCGCGKVQATIQTLEKAPPLRMVCYCKDCRGYYKTLNRIAEGKGQSPVAVLDNWGGVDWTAIYPRDITIKQGKDLLKTVKIRPESQIRQVYASCCHTPMFRFGDMSVLMNSNLIPDDQKANIDFRIVGRNAWKEGKDTAIPKPNMSWSVPFRWFWTMPKWMKKDLMQPLPMDLPEKENVEVLEGFKEG